MLALLILELFLYDLLWLVVNLNSVLWFEEHHLGELGSVAARLIALYQRQVHVGLSDEVDLVSLQCFHLLVYSEKIWCWVVDAIEISG